MDAIVTVVTMVFECHSIQSKLSMLFPEVNNFQRMDTESFATLLKHKIEPKCVCQFGAKDEGLSFKNMYITHLLNCSTCLQL